MNRISCSELKQELINKEEIILVNIREEYERTAFNVDSLHIPLSEIAKKELEM